MTKFVQRGVGATCLTILLAGIGHIAAAQVGHDPNSSPYHDIRLGNTVVVSGGQFDGSGGSLGVGPANGQVYSVRIERPLGRTLAAALTFAQAGTSRYIIDPTQDSLHRKSGPFDAKTSMIMLGLDASLTGGKTWRGFSPYIGATGGIAFENSLSADTSTYKFGNKAVIGPEAGLRLFLGKRLSLRGDFKLLYWKLSYPLTYKQPSPIDGTRVLAVDANGGEWTHNTYLTAGISWTF
ncbi:MAG TPA: hypothetical protein VLT79_02310 [Gemmatimonadales bacterium]|nr:hypothetical protein [Gemmatimonadales bacterium]